VVYFVKVLILIKFSCVPEID